MASLKQMAYKLQTALFKKNRFIKINQYQIYSPRQERMVTKYVMQEMKQNETQRENVTILETYQLAEIVKKLAELYGSDGP